MHTIPGTYALAAPSCFSVRWMGWHCTLVTSCVLCGWGRPEALKYTCTQGTGCRRRDPQALGMTWTLPLWHVGVCVRRRVHRA